MRQGKSVASAADREAVVNVLVARGMSQEEAAKTADNWQQTYQQAQAKMQDVKSDVKQDARAVADQTADAVSKGALGVSSRCCSVQSQLRSAARWAGRAPLSSPEFRRWKSGRRSLALV